MTRMDGFLPVFDASEKHSRLLKTSPEEAYAALQKIDLGDSFLIRFLFRLRGLRPGPFDKLKERFILLADDPPQELVLGLIAQPWKFDGGLQKISPTAFQSFHDPDFAKIVWNFTFVVEGTKTRVTTETRILCTDAASRRKFLRYWWFVKPFSGCVRLELLRLLRNYLNS